MKFVEQFKKEDFVKPSESSMLDRTGKDTDDEKKAFAKFVVIDTRSGATRSIARILPVSAYLSITIA
jgi:hypothetical protein